jgi:hypothetical protein
MDRSYIIFCPNLTAWILPCILNKKIMNNKVTVRLNKNNLDWLSNFPSPDFGKVINRALDDLRRKCKMLDVARKANTYPINRAESRNNISWVYPKAGL